MPPLACVTPYERHGRLWVDARDVIRSGIRLPVSPTGFVFEAADGSIYEVDGYSYTTRELLLRRFCFDWPERCG